MKHSTPICHRSFHVLGFCAAVSLLLVAPSASAASWNGIEPFKSKRADVVRILGQPTGETAEGVLRFNVMGGAVQISFVNENFVTSKKLRPDLDGTVLEIVLEHEHSSDTPESMRLVDNRAFTRDELKDETIFRNLKDGV